MTVANCNKEHQENFRHLFCASFVDLELEKFLCEICNVMNFIQIIYNMFLEYFIS